MSRENSGPAHARGCLGAMTVSDSPTGHGHCACERAAWLDELVPRARARAEVLAQLATWAHEQGVFAEDEVAKPELHDGPRRSSWRQASLRLGGHLAREVYIGVRMTALALAKECARTEPDVAPAAAGPIASAAGDLASAVDAALAAGEVRALLHPELADAAVTALRAELVARLTDSGTPEADAKAASSVRAVRCWDGNHLDGVSSPALVGEHL